MTVDTIVRSGGAVVSVTCESPNVQRALLAGAGVQHPSATSDEAPPDVRVVVEESRRGFPVEGYELVTRGVWRGSAGDMVFEDAGGSGFSQRWSVGAHGLDVHARWKPSPLEWGAARLLTSRFRALRAQVLLHYPVLWWAAVRGEAPLHVSVLEIDGVVIMLAGPGGVGKSTLVAQELSAGAKVVCDNLAVSDGDVANGISEPLRLPAELAGNRTGARTTHGRRESSWAGRVPALRPDMVVVVSRGGAYPTVASIDPSIAQRALVAGTYGAGELRRFWHVSAMAALATGLGPAHPPVEHVAMALTSRLPCFELVLGSQPGARLLTMLRNEISAVHGGEVQR